MYPYCMRFGILHIGPATVNWPVPHATDAQRHLSMWWFEIKPRHHLGPQVAGHETDRCKALDTAFTNGKAIDLFDASATVARFPGTTEDRAALYVNM